MFFGSKTKKSNDTNHEHNKVSELNIYQKAKGISVSNSKTVEKAGRTNRHEKSHDWS